MNYTHFSLWFKRYTERKYSSSFIEFESTKLV